MRIMHDRCFLNATNFGEYSFEFAVVYFETEARDVEVVAWIVASISTAAPSVITVTSWTPAP